MDKRAFLTKWAVVSFFLLLAYHAHHHPIKLPTIGHIQDKRIEEQAQAILASPPGTEHDIDDDIEEEVWSRVYHRLGQRAEKERRDRRKKQMDAWKKRKAQQHSK